jgi:hypothetical protein
MHQLSTLRFIIKRLADDWKLLLSIFLGVTVATTLIAGTPVYLRALQRLSLNTAIDRSSEVFLDIFALAPHIPLDGSSVQRADQLLDDAIQRNISEIYQGRERYVKAPTFLVGLPDRPLTGADGDRVSRGYFQYLSNIENHVNFIEGRMATDTITQGPRGPVVEAVIGVEAAKVFDLKAGDAVVLTPSLGDRTRMTATIVGVIDPADPTERYWQHNANVFLEPAPLEEVPDVGVEVDPEEPPLSLFITREALIEGVGKAYPGTVVNSTWFVFVDKEALKKWPIDKARGSVAALDNALSSEMQGSAVFTGIKRLIAEFENRSFFSSVPLLLLLSIMVMTVLYYLAMMVSYLVQSRESDVALLRSRGTSTLQLLRLYAIEGLVLVTLAVMLAPFLAMGLVAAAGMLPYLQELTKGSLLPVELHWQPFAVAAGAGLLSLAIFVVPGVVGARAGLVIHKLRSSRPPSMPFFQRYYLDVALLVIGGLVFWELQARGHFVSGGLFKGIQVNEALLLAPILFLTAVALLFMRFFPLFVRYISGESPTLIHLLVAATLVALAPATAAREVRDGSDLGWVFPVIVLMALAGAYWATTQRAQRAWSVTAGMVLQAALVALFLWLEPPEARHISFVPTVSLIAIVPAQLLFALFKSLSRLAPVWLSMGLWHMARNPLQYSWLVLLLVLVTGLGVLATSVGGTLNRSYQERILYDVAADIRVSAVPGYLARGRQALKEVYATIPGVTSVSLALRGGGTTGSNFAGDQFDVLALESQDFQYISWYRDDFSERPLSGIMRALQPPARVEPLIIPERATRLGVWAKPLDSYANVFLWMVIQDGRGITRTVTLGRVGEPEWHLMTTEIPTGLEPPLQLVSLQIFEPVFGPAGTPGAILLDDIQAFFGLDGEGVVLEDFEQQVSWTTLATSALSSDRLAPTREDVHRGERSGLFTFGKDTDRGIRGVYRSPTGGPMPVVTSASFQQSTGTRIGDVMIVNVLGRLIPIVIRDTAYYFPTLDPTDDSGFILADLDSLLRHLNIVSPTTTFTPNELFISKASGSGDSVRETVISLVGASELVHDMESQLEAVRLDPLLAVGWKAMMVLALGIIVFTAGLGYVTYLLSFANRSRTEMGFLRSMGMSRRQITGLLSLEHLVVALIGLGLGTWAGFQMSNLMVSSVSVTEEGDPVIPPFILMTDWSFMAPIYLALVAIFALALYRLTRSMLKLDLHAISRTEGE